MGFVGGLDLAGVREFTTAACCQAADLSAGRAPLSPSSADAAIGLHGGRSGTAAQPISQNAPSRPYWVAAGSIQLLGCTGVDLGPLRNPLARMSRTRPNAPN